MQDFVNTLVAADQRCRSWREKLDFVRELLVDEAVPLATGQLAGIAIYLRFLGTGQIACVEDGRHFRPAHHARISLQIQERLATLSGPDAACLARKIYPWLPSSSPTFQRPEPLTRIRDIAHRNDLPSELKQEIKHTLQNKLHRCAGPEDLVVSAALLQKITAPGAHYSSDFVGQFRIFHDELKEFFNARSLDERLTALRPHLGDSFAALIQSFCEAKAGHTVVEQLTAFKALTTLREHLLGVVKTRSGAETQGLLLADIGLEDFAFVRLSELLNEFEAAREKVAWWSLLEILALTLTNLALSGVEVEECRVIEAELRAWGREFAAGDREHLLRLKATVERSRRVAENYSDRITSLFPALVEQLGRALGVAEHAIRIYCEAEIRSHLSFQLAKLASLILRRLREELTLPAWDVVVAGRAVGRVIALARLDEMNSEFAEPVVVLLRAAEGDEEIPRGVAGIVLAHELPHLSHLGVRARQAGIVLVACEERAKFEDLQLLNGQWASLTATTETVEWKISSPQEQARDRAIQPAVKIPSVQLAPKRPWLPLEQVLPDNGGGKADGARRLAEWARRTEAGFKTPPAWVIPFGVMESALRAAPEVAADYQASLKRINDWDAAEFTAAAARLRELIHQLAVPAEIAAELAEKFGDTDRLMVRSSANCEDLEELAGAGLYDSIANVAVAEVAAAVRGVWASLWTRRAALSRRQANIPHEHAHMAVLVQQMLVPDFSFVLHTVNPLNHNPGEVYAEIAVGLGETLASAATRGSPYRLVGNKVSGAISTLAFASFSEALWPDTAGGVMRKVVDYSQIELSRDSEARQRLGKRLAALASFVEAAFLRPQDLEGVVVGDEIYLVQSRPQQGLQNQKS